MNRPTHNWSEQKREAFWRFVQGRRAELRLTQEQVAHAIGLDRSGLTRRLQGQVNERPTEWMVRQLVEILELDEAGAEKLLSLAGYKEKEEPHAASPDSVASPDDGRPPDRDAEASRAAGRHWREARMLALVVAAVVTAFMRSGFLKVPPRGRVDVEPNSNATIAAIVPGGLWISPVNGDTVAGPIHFAARAYPSSPSDPPIAFVNFTVSWEGRAGPWLVACRVDRPSDGDVYACDWNPAAAKVPAGPLHLSFDVYDQAKKPNANLAPNGTRAINYAPG